MDNKQNSRSRNDINESCWCQSIASKTYNSYCSHYCMQNNNVDIIYKPASQHYSELKLTPLSTGDIFSMHFDKNLGHWKLTDLLNWILRKQFRYDYNTKDYCSLGAWQATSRMAKEASADWPTSAAVFLFLFNPLISEPAASSKPTVGTLPHAAARCNGVKPWSCVSNTSLLWSRRSCTTEIQPLA